MRHSFDGFEIDPDAGRLCRAGVEVPLERRAFEMLCYLAAHPGRLITKDELLSEVWRAAVLSDGVLANTAAKVRKALGQAPSAREPLETVRGRGFRWRAAPIERSTASSPSPVEADPFVGRSALMERLVQLVDGAAQGEGQVVCLVGEAGIGKTRTLAELGKHARARGFSVWEGAAYDGGVAPAYWLWVEILRSAHADLSRAMFRRHVGSHSWALALLVPELLDADARPGNADAPATRFRLFDEIAQLIASASNDAPRLIVCDDLQWADDASLELLAYVARSLKKRSVVLAVAMREHDTRAQDARSLALQRLERGATRVVLSGLSMDETGELIAELRARNAVAAGVAGALHRRTQGSPFFVRQMLELIAQRGEPLDEQTLDRLGLPEAVRGVSRQRVLALNDDARVVLRAAAAAGADFEAQLLADVLGFSLERVLAALEQARRKHVIAGDRLVPHRFTFDHVLLREVIYDDLELVERGALHARFAEVLEHRPLDADPRRLGELARHALLAVPSQLDACVCHCRNAARAARSALGYDAAAEILLKACDKLASEGGDARVRCELLQQLGIDRFCAGNIRNAWQALLRAAALAEQIEAPDLLARAACRLAIWLEIGGGDEDEARRYVDRALQLVSESDPDLRATLLAYRAAMLWDLPADERRSLLHQAEALAARHNQPEVLMDIAVCRVNLSDPTQLEENRAAIAHYRRIAQSHTAMPATLRLLRNFTVSLSDYQRLLTLCDLDAADAVLERCHQLAQESQVMALERVAEMMGAGRALADARFADVSVAVQRLAEAAGVTGGLGLVWQFYAARLAEAQRGFTGLQEMVASMSSSDRFRELRPSQRMTGLLGLARVNAKIGAHATARRLLSSIDSELLDCLPSRHGDLWVLCLLAETYHALGDGDGAARLYPRLLPHAALNAVGPAFDYEGAVAYYLGLLAELLDCRDHAARHFEDAEVVNRKLRMPLHVARCQAARAALGSIERRPSGGVSS
jgi:DNA-binding winged helix-turn-helix (wHTH) protein/tetratricopeptide (TPR) repeat protein